MLVVYTVLFFCLLTCIVLIVLFCLFYRYQEHCYDAGTSVVFKGEGHVKGHFLHVVHCKYFLTSHVLLLYQKIIYSMHLM